MHIDESSYNLNLLLTQSVILVKRFEKSLVRGFLLLCLCKVIFNCQETFQWSKSGCSLPRPG